MASITGTEFIMNELEIAILKAELFHALGNCTHSHYLTFDFDDASHYQYEFERLETMTRMLAASRTLASLEDFKTVLMEVELQVSIHLAKLLEPTIDPALAGTITSRVGDDGDGNVVICGVCQEEMEKGDEARAIEECMHLFHDSCILEWLKIKRTCPLCRAACKPKKLEFQEIKHSWIHEGNDYFVNDDKRTRWSQNCQKFRVLQIN